jgi:preprotein translocase subunit Sec63
MQKGSERWLRVLGLEAGASEQAVKEAYRDLMKVWHPDRFGTDARLREKAQTKLTEVNAAYEHLRNYRPSDPFAARPPQRTSPVVIAAGRREKLLAVMTRASPPSGVPNR